MKPATVLVWMTLVAAAIVVLPAGLGAQGAGAAPAAPGATSPPRNARAAAPIDFTGQWVSVVTEDWRYRMITPPKGNYAGVPLNPAGRKIADGWDPARGEAAGEPCKAYGAANIMRVPGRIRVSWADDDTLKVETDAGMQTRMFHFGQPKGAAASWQGVSQASWEATTGLDFFTIIRGRGERNPAPTSAFKVVTTGMRPGYLRRNGVPYSEKAVLTEYYDRTIEANGDSWLVVTSIVDDPTYLHQPFVTSAHFKKQMDQSGWNPTPCSAR